ncbi:MAG: hypothetical protein ACXW3D_07695 [Caulobacteraceae bacterium]
MEPAPYREATPNPIDKGAAMLNYIFLIISPFTLGFLAVIALIFAYLRRGGSDPMTRTHYDHQIKNFWHDFLILILGILCGIGAIAAGAGSLLGLTGIQLPGGYGSGQAGLLALGLGAAWAILWIWGFLGLFLGSVRGALRLARGAPIH